MGHHFGILNIVWPWSRFYVSFNQALGDLEHILGLRFILEW